MRRYYQLLFVIIALLPAACGQANELEPVTDSQPQTSTDTVAATDSGESAAETAATATPLPAGTASDSDTDTTSVGSTETGSVAASDDADSTPTFDELMAAILEDIEAGETPTAPESGGSGAVSASDTESLQTDPTATPVPVATQATAEDEPATAVPTAAPLPTSPPVVDSGIPGDALQQINVLNEIYQTVVDNYVSADFNGKNWGGLRDQYAAKVNSGLSDVAFYTEMGNFIGELGDGHSYYMTPSEVDGYNALIRGQEGYAGIGVIVLPDTANRNALVAWAINDNAAYQAGIRSRDRILAVNGQALCCDKLGELFDELISGPEGSSAEFTVQSPGQSPRDVTVTRRSIQINDAVETARYGNIGYIALYSFLIRDIHAEFETAWRELSAGDDLEGLIIDMRPNTGGFEREMIRTVELFVDGKLGDYSSRGGTSPLMAAGLDVNGSQSIPLAVLIGEASNSNGEIFPGVLQEAGRATLIGAPTRGNVETIFPYDLSDGSRVWVAQERFNAPSGTIWEGLGVQPDVLVRQPWSDVTGPDADEALQTAVDFLQR